jgi:phosphoglycerate kinase
LIQYLSKLNPQKLKGVALLRLDFNTEDSWRLEAALPTVKLLSKHADAVVIISHRGRPDFVKDEAGRLELPPYERKRLSLKKDADILRKFLKKKVKFIPHFNFGEILETVTAGEKGQVFLLENIRFLPGEAENDPELAKNLAALADYYVNDAFAVSHRAVASIAAITKYLRSYAGLVMEKEIRSLSGVVNKFKHPFAIIVGGGKAHDKLEVLENFRAKADFFLLGGAPANTILSLQGIEVEHSLMDDDAKDLAILRKFLSSRKVIYPVDWKTEKGAILDIGPATAATYAGIIQKARTILWAGPMGFIEKKKFADGTLIIAKAIAKNKRAFSVTGGGETVMFLKKKRLDKAFSFISTGGGAMVEFLAGKHLPGIKALEK